MNKYKFSVISCIIILLGVLCGFAVINFKDKDINAADAYLTSNRYAVDGFDKGTVKSVLVKKDDAVKKGQVLAEILIASTADSSLQKSDSSAVLKTKLDEAEQNHTNAALMYKDGVISQHEYDKSLEKLVAARKLYKNSKAQSSIKPTPIIKKIYSPVDGVVEIDYVKKGDDISKGKNLFLIDTDELKIMAYFETKYKKSLKTGSKVVIANDKYGDKTFDGEIEFVNDAPQSHKDMKSKVYLAVIKFDKDNTHPFDKKQQVSVSLKR